MPLRGPRFSGDPVLEECFAGRHRMLAPEEGLPVMRVQAALIELGRSVGPHGADGIFGDDTGAAVSAYKEVKVLHPTDPVVGPGTSKALDDDLFVDPPTLDPAFAEFSPFVVAHRVEPFVGRELAPLMSAPLDSWRHMVANAAVRDLGSGFLLGIVAGSRAIDLREPYLAVADADQGGGVSADQHFDDSIVARGGAGQTVTFRANNDSRALCLIADDVFLGRQTIVRTSDGTHAPVTLLGALVHELTHARNLATTEALRLTPDTDADTYVDTALAQARSASGGTRTVEVLDSFVGEMVARHVHWIVQQELAGTPGDIAVRFLEPGKLAAAVNFYFADARAIYDSNGYGAGIVAEGDAARFRQLELWLRICAQQLFSDDASQGDEATQLFEAAARFCADQATSPASALPEPDGLFPLPADFH
jgi:peptidoglycan hydrolase-like protein with peptidoglycan-binding domain